MATTIPINSLINVSPSVIGTGGGLNHLSAVIISTNNSVLQNYQVKAYTNSTSVGMAFGMASPEYAMAQAYFSGTSTSLLSPSVLYFAGHTDGTALSATFLNAITGRTAASSLVGNSGFQGIATAFSPAMTEMQAIANWVHQTKLYWYVSWDNNSAETAIGDTTSFGVWLRNQGLDGTTALYDSNGVSAGAALGWMASLDFDRLNGRSTLAYRSNAYVSPIVTDGTTAYNLLQNNYNYYGSYANGTQAYQFFQDGSVSGSFLWADSYVNQIWMNTNFQNSLMNLVTNTGNIPFNTQGDTLIAAALQDTISAALNFGAIRSGVTLSASEAQAVNSLTGNTTSSQTLQTQGWILIPGASTASATTRSARGPIKPIFIYTDGQSVQTINMASIEVQ